MEVKGGKSLLQVVDGTLLKGDVKDSNSEYFYMKPRRHSEEEYKQLLIDSQEYFEGIGNGSISTEDRYFIYAPQFYLDKGIATKAAVIKEGLGNAVDAKLIYIKNPIRVRPVEDGFVYAGYDGRHRFAVAQKYKLKLLVDVISTEKMYGEYDTNRLNKEKTKLSIKDKFIIFLMRLFK